MNAFKSGKIERWTSIMQPRTTITFCHIMKVHQLGLCGTEGGGKFLDIDICMMSNTEPMFCAC